MSDNKETFDLRTLFPKNEWYKLLKEQFDEEYFKKLEDQLYVDYDKLLPDPSVIFRAFKQIPAVKNVRVLILGQDPYPTPGKANGLAFSVDTGQKIPPSLRNIFTEAGIKNPVSGDLSAWAAQGVFLLNTALTVRAGEAGAHLEYWEPFTDAVIEAVAREAVRPVVFVLWGKQAQAKDELIRDGYILRAAHPSRYSAHKGFIGCDHFNKINEILTEQGERPINWRGSIEGTVGNALDSISPVQGRI